MKIITKDTGNKLTIIDRLGLIEKYELQILATKFERVKFYFRQCIAKLYK